MLSQIQSSGDVVEASSCLSADECISRMGHTHTMENAPALKRNEILTHGKAWMNLGDIMLHGISQSEKSKYFVIPL